MIKIKLIILLLFVCMLAQSQIVLSDIDKYQQKSDKIGNKIIKKYCRQLGLTQEQKLSSMLFYAVYQSKCFSKKPMSASDFLSNYKCWDKYRCFVYDDSYNVKAYSLEQRVFSGDYGVDSRIINYIVQIKAKYIFFYLLYEIFVCYCENGDIILVQKTESDNGYKSIPLSEWDDWYKFNEILKCN